MFADILKANTFNGKNITYKNVQCGKKHIQVNYQFCTNNAEGRALGIRFELLVQPGNYQISNELSSFVNEYCNIFKCISCYEEDDQSGKAFRISPRKDLKEYNDKIIDILQSENLLTFDSLNEIELNCDADLMLYDLFIRRDVNNDKMIKFETHAKPVEEKLDTLLNAKSDIHFRVQIGDAHSVKDIVIQDYSSNPCVKRVEYNEQVLHEIFAVLFG